MRSILNLSKLAIVAGLLLLAAACTEAASTAPDTSDFSKDYQSYSKDGLSLQYPNQWKFSYDDPQGLYSDRAVAFDATEDSRLTIYIFNETGKTASDVANIFVQRLKLETKEHIKNYVNSPTRVGNYDGIKLSWTNAMLFPYTTEIIILQVVQSPTPIFVVFELLEEDVEKITPHILPVLDSIKFQL